MAGFISTAMGKLRRKMHDKEVKAGNAADMAGHMPAKGAASRRLLARRSTRQGAARRLLGD